MQLETEIFGEKTDTEPSAPEEDASKAQEEAKNLNVQVEGCGAEVETYTYIYI